MKRYNIPDAAERYLAGESAKDIAKSYGVSPIVITKRLKEAGVHRNVQEAQRLRHGTNPVDDAEIVRLYVSGSSEKAVADQFGISRGTVRNILVKLGVQPRGRSDSMYLRMSQTSKAERLRLTDAAHAAVRGVPQSEEHRIKAAKTRQRLKTQASPAEIEFAEALFARNIVTVPQLAVGRYNVDLAIAEASIAVEIFGGHWHASGFHGARHRKRMDYLLDRGWLPIIIWVTGQFPLSPKAVDYVVACRKAVRSGEPVRREEHVIRGDGEGGPVSQGYPACVPMIPCYKPGFDPRSDDARAG